MKLTMHGLPVLEDVVRGLEIGGGTMVYRCGGLWTVVDPSPQHCDWSPPDGPAELHRLRMTLTEAVRGGKLLGGYDVIFSSWAMDNMPDNNHPALGFATTAEERKALVAALKPGGKLIIIRDDHPGFEAVIDNYVAAGLIVTDRGTDLIPAVEFTRP